VLAAKAFPYACVGGWLFGALFLIGLGIPFIIRSRQPSKRFDSLSGIKFFDKDVFNEWRRSGYQPPAERVPTKVKIRGRKVFIKLPEASVPSAKKWTKRILDVPSRGALECSRVDKPFMRIEPNQILWFRGGGKTEEMKKAKEVLVNIADNIERQGY
jgi:hypothetical protein